MSSVDANDEPLPPRVYLVCGIPGSGKTSFSNSLHTVLMRECGSSYLLSFDDVEVPREEWNSNSFKESRNRGLEMLSRFLDGVEVPRSIVVDDIMYLSSMRHDVYKLCRDRLVPLVVVHLDVSLKECLASNRERPVERQVDEEVIERIYRSFERPKISSICDRLHYTVEGRPSDLEARAIEVVHSTKAGIRERKEQLIRDKEQALAHQAAAKEAADVPESNGAAFDRHVRVAISALIRGQGLDIPKPALAQLLSKAKAVGQNECRGGASVEEALIAFVGHVREARLPQGEELVAALERALQ